MEIFQLRYFMETVKLGGLLPAGRRLHISVAAISRAISHIENELGIKLFHRVGRKLQLTNEGKVFVTQAEKILNINDETLYLFKGQTLVPELVLAGREIFLAEYALPITERFRSKFPASAIKFLNTTGDEALQKVKRGEAHAAVVVQNAPEGWSSTTLEEVKCVVCVSKNHPLSKVKKKNSIQEVLEHAFVSPSSNILGRLGSGASPDGWRDDIHPRKIQFINDSLEVFHSLVKNGKAMAYVPEFWADRYGFKKLEIKNIKHECTLQIKLCTPQLKTHSWLSLLFP